MNRYNRSITFSLLTMLLLALVGSPIASAQSTYRLTNLGGWSGGQISFQDFNNQGQLVGIVLDGSDWHSFLWECNGTATELSEPPGSENFVVRGINDQGKILGTLGNKLTTYTSVGGWVDVAPDNPVSLGSKMDINNRGEIVGSNPAQRGFLYLPEAAYGLKKGMNDLGPEGPTSHAAGINNLGQVNGDTNNLGTPFALAAVWKEGVMSTLPTLPGREHYTSYDINDLGQITGNAYSSSLDNRVAVLWERGADGNYVAVDLGITDTYALGFSLNNLGQIIITAESASGTPRTYLWQNGTAMEINDLLSSSPDWTNLEAAYINDNGQIVGSGLYKGEKSVFCADLTPVVPDPDVPEPGALAVLGAVSVSGLLFLRRRR